jgi:hypothetical protein
MKSNKLKFTLLFLALSNQISIPARAMQMFSDTL